jgi:uncharacterized delta-60 repeat protein
VVADVDGATNTLRDLALLADGRIVAAGDNVGDFEGSERTDLIQVLPDGSLDPSFGDGGTLGIDGDKVGEGMVVQPDARIVLVGRALLEAETQFEAVRLMPDGTLDTSFGDGGSVRTDLRDHTEAALDVALDEQARIVVAGRAGDYNTDFALVRYLSDGSVDRTFADQGVLYVDFGMLPDIAESVAVAPDGSIVASGFSQGTTDRYGVTRILP